MPEAFDPYRDYLIRLGNSAGGKPQIELVSAARPGDTDWDIEFQRQLGVLLSESNGRWCRSCGSDFQRPHISLIGFTAVGSLVMLGQCCATMVAVPLGTAFYPARQTMPMS
jgi:hypothetical protein